MKQWYIATAFAVVYLAVSLALEAWPWSWSLWVVYAGYRFWDNNRQKTDN